jgi:hypothetical protein
MIARLCRAAGNDYESRDKIAAEAALAQEQAQAEDVWAAAMAMSD